ncbi:hypothetical protein [Azohydromonas caseinilytica]|uniref:Uncharacterized protein n=1 Tax=Azohydromonas caseinilytica TaxID=2728836 RepID=A0A848FEH0_9BURK|nr:hypothetical protein [Azohydromonas caseinilytica]NML17692.1 hypothetical protein [Azohydromonas caseinilytica]
MLTVQAVLLPDGQIQLPSTLRRDKPVPVLVTFLDAAEPQAAGQGSVPATLALLQSCAFRSLPPGDPQDIEQRIREIRQDWDAE